jgi:NTP pyrophosphatase (non-canonical NTP hydrolase)
MNLQKNVNTTSPFRQSPSLYDFDRFVRATWKTADEPFEKQLAIAALGLTGEAGETVEHVKKYLRDGKNLLRVEEGQEDPEFIKELGDVLYYVLKLTQLVGVPIEYVIWAVVDKLNQRREDSGKPRVELDSDLPLPAVEPGDIKVVDPEQPDESLSFEAVLAIIQLKKLTDELRANTIDLGEGKGIIKIEGTHEEIGRKLIQAIDCGVVLERELCK